MHIHSFGLLLNSGSVIESEFCLIETGTQITIWIGTKCIHEMNNNKKKPYKYSTLSFYEYVWRLKKKCVDLETIRSKTSSFPIRRIHLIILKHFLFALFFSRMLEMICLFFFFNLLVSWKIICEIITWKAIIQPSFEFISLYSVSILLAPIFCMVLFVMLFYTFFLNIQSYALLFFSSFCCVSLCEYNWILTSYKNFESNLCSK